MNACTDENMEEAKRLIALGAMVDWQDALGQTSLHIASMHGYTEIMRMIIEHKAHVNLTNNYGNTPLVMAAYNNHMTSVQLLVNACCDITICNDKDLTAARLATKARAPVPSPSTSPT